MIALKLINMILRLSNLKLYIRVPFKKEEKSILYLLKDKKLSKDKHIHISTD